MSINYIGAVNSTSYGVCCTNTVHALTKLGVHVNLFPVDRSRMECHPKLKESVELSLSRAAMFDHDAPCIRQFHQFSLDLFAGSDEHIGYPIFELDAFNGRELHHLFGCDRLFVPTNWAKQVVKDQFYYHFKTVDAKIDVIPLGVDRDIFSPQKISRPETIFLNIGKWEVRKGHDVLGEAFTRAFSENDNVMLWIAADNTHYTPEENARWRSLFEKYRRPHQIKFIPWLPLQEDVASVINQADVLLSLSRAEGWELPLLEGMSCGKHVIATNYSGHTEFCTPENSRLIDIKEFVVADDRCEALPEGKWFRSGIGRWADIGENQIEQCVRYMRNIHEIKQAGSLRLNEAGIETAKKFSWENTANKITECLL